MNRIKAWSLAYAGGAAAAPVLGTTVSWPAGLLALGGLLVIFGCRLLSQWQHRKTLIAFVAALRSWGKVGSLRPESQQRWLFAVLVNKAVDTWRRIGRLDVTDTFDGLDRPGAADETYTRAACAIAWQRAFEIIQQMPSARLPGEPVVLFTQTANARSMRLAAKLGFTEVERYQVYGAEQWSECGPRSRCPVELVLTATFRCHASRIRNPAGPLDHTPERLTPRHRV